jgi:MurNAc alpha-1-phosphate uridylyltransferase
LNRLYDQALAAGRLFGLVHDGDWFHVGTPEDLAVTERLMSAGGSGE